MAAIPAILALAPLIAAPRGAPATQLASEDLVAALDLYHRATIGNDTRTLGALVTDDYMLVNSDSTVQGKDSYLADFAVPGFKIDPYRMEHAFTKIHAETALTGGTFRLRWTQAGRRQTRHLRAAHFWVRQHGRWRLAYSQLTRIPERAGR